MIMVPVQIAFDIYFKRHYFNTIMKNRSSNCHFHEHVYAYLPILLDLIAFLSSHKAKSALKDNIY